MVFHKVSACRDRTWDVLYHKHFVTSQKCPYLPARRSDFHEITKVSVSRDLWPWPRPWEQTLDAGSSGDHLVQVLWRSSHLPGRRSDLRKSLQTDTDGRRTTRDCISSWNELKISNIITINPHLVKSSQKDSVGVFMTRDAEWRLTKQHKCKQFLTVTQV